MSKKKSNNTLKFKEETQPRRVFPQDHEILRVLAFRRNSSFMNILNDIHKFAKIRLRNQKVSYYDSFIKYNTPSVQHKSVRIPTEFNDFLISLATKERTAKFLLSAMIQDYIESNQKILKK